jgi:hypothetical protein
MSAAMSETQLHVRTSLDQKACAATRLGQGGYVITWSSYLHDGASGAVVARLFDVHGRPLIDEFQVNQTTAGNQTAPAVAVAGPGTILIAWQSTGGSGDSEDNDIMARLYDPNGQALNDEFRVNAHMAEEQTLPRAAGCPDGSFLVAWESEGLPGHERKAICVRRISPEGLPIGDDIIASDTPQYTCRYAGLAANALGDYTVTWLEDRTTDGVRQRRFGPDDLALDASTKVNTRGFKSLTWPDCSMNDSGYTVITWDGDPNAAVEDDIHARIYDPNGDPVGDEFQVHTAAPGPQRNPAVCTDASGSFVIAWDTEAPDQGRDIMARLFDMQGQALTDAYRVNEHLPEDQSEPVVILSRDRTLLVAWQSQDQDGSNWGVYGSFGPVLLSADLNADGRIDFSDFQKLSQAWQSPPSTASDLHRDHRLDYLDIWTFCTQWLQAAEE